MKLEEMYARGHTLEEVGKAYGITRNTVRKILINSGVRIRTNTDVWASKQKPVENPNGKPVPEDWLELYEARKTGMSYQKLADTFYCSISTVNYRLRQVRKRGTK